MDSAATRNEGSAVAYENAGDLETGGACTSEKRFSERSMSGILSADFRLSAKAVLEAACGGIG